MKGILVILAIGLVGGFSPVLACDKGHAQVSQEEDEVYRVTFKDVDLSNYRAVEVVVKGVMCMNCLDKIEANLRKVRGTVAMEYDWKSKTLKVWGENISLDRIISAIKRAGYKAEPKQA